VLLYHRRIWMDLFPTFSCREYCEAMRTKWDLNEKALPNIAPIAAGDNVLSVYSNPSGKKKVFSWSLSSNIFSDQCIAFMNSLTASTLFIFLMIFPSNDFSVILSSLSKNLWKPWPYFTSNFRSDLKPIATTELLKISLLWVGRTSLTVEMDVSIW
jgi:hypothetical protein